MAPPKPANLYGLDHTTIAYLEKRSARLFHAGAQLEVVTFRGRTYCIADAESKIRLWALRDAANLLGETVSACVPCNGAMTLNDANKFQVAALARRITEQLLEKHPRLADSIGRARRVHAVALRRADREERGVEEREAPGPVTPAVWSPAVPPTQAWSEPPPPPPPPTTWVPPTWAPPERAAWPRIDDVRRLVDSPRLVTLSLGAGAGSGSPAYIGADDLPLYAALCAALGQTLHELPHTLPAHVVAAYFAQDGGVYTVVRRCMCRYRQHWNVFALDTDAHARAERGCTVATDVL